MGLDSYLVTLGIKGQDVVLSTMDKVQKKGKALSKPVLNNIQMKTQSKSGKIQPSQNTPENAAEQPNKYKKNNTAEQTYKTKQGKDLEKTSKGFKDLAKNLNDGDKKLKQFSKGTGNSAKQQKESLSVEKKKNDIAKKTIDRTGNAAKGVAGAAASLDPGATVKSMIAVPSAAALAIPFAGAFIAAAGGMVQMGVDAAKGAVEQAKQSTATAYSLTQRNAATTNYGGAGVNKGKMSNEEHAQLVMSISGVFGKLKSPMQEQLNRLSGRKDTGALSRVASGDWKSTGTDKGFFLQKLSDSFGDLPPSIAQKFQATLLGRYGNEIQEKAPGQEKLQERAGKWADTSEKQSFAVYDKLSEESKIKYKDANGKEVEKTESHYDTLVGLNEKMNSLQVELVKNGSELAGIVGDLTTGVKGFMQAVGGAADKLKYLSAKAGIGK